MSEATLQRTRDYYRIEEVIGWLSEQTSSRPSLEQAAQQLGLSEYHFQRLFSRWVGISPKRFQQFLLKQSARERLLSAENLLQASYDLGLSGPGRLHDLMVQCEAVTPGELRAAGAGLEIRYGVAASPFGWCFLAQTSRGICKLSFLDQPEDPQPLQELQRDWPKAELQLDNSLIEQTLERIFSTNVSEPKPLYLLLKGTNFQVQVWEALLRVPPGGLVSYQTLAESIGVPKASRAVGSAVARNPIGYLIPCHRVIQKSGLLGNYRWGAPRKQVLIGVEGMEHQAG